MWWALVFAAVLLIGVTKSGFGSGVGLMIVPMVTIAFGNIPNRGSEMALGFILPLLVVGDLLAVGQYQNLFFAGTARQYVLKLLPGTAVGVILGAALLWFLHRQANLVGALIRIEIGIESVLLVSLHWWRIWRGTRRNLLREPLRSHLTGGFAAVSSTLAHAAGPIIAMYLLPLQMDRQLYVGTCAVYFFILNTAKLPAYWASGQFAHLDPALTLKMLPLVIAGAIFGKWINRRMNDQTFTKIVYAITFCLGWYILIDGILRLYGRHIT
jgi:uncharacterized membrane protein YfcA